MVRDSVEWPLRDLLSHRVEASPDHLAVIDETEDRQWTYRILDDYVNWTAERLLERNLSKGDRLGTLIDTGSDFVVLFHATMRLGMTLVPLNTELTAAEITPQSERAGLDALICVAQTEATAVNAVDVPVFSLDESSDPQVDSINLAQTQEVALKDTIERSSADEVASRNGDREPANTAIEPVISDRSHTQLILFTSGTTGEPKGVRITVGNLLASATASAFRLGIKRSDRWLVCLPIYHMGGLAPVIRATLYGTTIDLQRSFDVNRTPMIIRERDITGISLVPTMLRRLLEAGWSPPAHLRFALVGGAPTPRDLVERALAKDVPVHPTYGATETASQVATATPAEVRDQPGTVGHPLMFADITIIDEGQPCERGHPGELVVDGPMVAPGYLDERRTQAVYSDNGLHTGDVGFRDEAGRLWLLGRLDDAISTGGETVYPTEVADVIRTHPAVADAAVVGLPDEEWGQRVAALLVTDAAVAPGVNDLRASVESHCREQLAGFKIPRTWGITDELPRTASGTIDRDAVRERLSE